MRVRLTRAEWDGLQEYNRRMLRFHWPEQPTSWERVCRLLREAAPFVACVVLREGYELPPRMVAAIPPLMLASAMEVA